MSFVRKNMDMLFVTVLSLVGCIIYAWLLHEVAGLFQYWLLSGVLYAVVATGAFWLLTHLASDDELPKTEDQPMMLNDEPIKESSLSIHDFPFLFFVTGITMLSPIIAVAGLCVTVIDRVIGGKNSTDIQSQEDPRVSGFQAVLDDKGIRAGDKVAIVHAKGHRTTAWFDHIEEREDEEPVVWFEDFRVEDEISDFSHGFGVDLSNLAEIDLAKA